jgi:hypothetical protein
MDGNQPAIVAALRQSGCSVQSLASVGGGCPDLLVARAGRLWLMEIKDPSQDLNKQRLTPAQILWHFDWKSRVHIVKTPGAALAVVDANA